ncbi:V-type proton ATPase subunit S1-like [Lytechinus variegatus]|uniref:V-type proton ATPase subunit S1-like n=1 Tax=Lytechinus variegatus TaxID=7654 RepID=UPI001BB18C75|nr:V-type proton ATPase subunit S1-like [Lytechinus variegatus]
MDKLVVVGLFVTVVIFSAASASNVPVVAWSNTRSLFGTRQISAGEEVGKESLRNDFVNHVIGADQKPQTIILVLINKLKLGDLTRYSNAYDAQNQGGIIPNIKSSMESSASSLVLPQTDTSDLLDDLMSKVTGLITEISNPVDVQSLALDSKQTNLVIVRVEPSDSVEEQLKAADKYVKILMNKFNGRSTPFTLFFTASPISQDSSHASGRRLLQASDGDAAKFAFINFTEDGCQLYFFAANINVQYVKGADGKKNESVPLPTTGWVSTGSDCLTNRSLIFNLGISDLEGLNGTDWIESVSFKVEFNMTARDFWYVSKSSITAQLKGQKELTHMVDLHELETPLGWSYHCGDITFVSKQQPNKTDDMVNLIFKDFQIQPFGIENDKFSQANDCIGYFSPAIWMGIMTALLVIAIIGFGIGMMATVKVMDKFDDPKGKQLMINVPES